MAQSLAIYDQVDWWNPHHSLLRMAKFKFDYFQEKIGPLNGKSILDIGCGGGIITEELAKAGANVTGVDLSEKALQTARDHAAAGGLRIRYELGKAEDLPVADERFDAVVCADCLEHVDDLSRVIEEVSRVLKLGGTFCYDTFNRNLLSKVLIVWLLNRRLRREYRRLNVTEREFAVHDWKKFIKPEELTALMARHGLSSLEVKGIRYGRCGFRVGGKPKIAYIGHGSKSRFAAVPCDNDKA